MPLHRADRVGPGLVVVSLAVVGLFVADAVRAGLDIANAMLGVFVVLVPTVLIGVCKGAMMHCHMVTMPTLVALGVLLAVFAATAAYCDAKPVRRA